MRKHSGALNCQSLINRIIGTKSNPDHHLFYSMSKIVVVAFSMLVFSGLPGTVLSANSQSSAIPVQSLTIQQKTVPEWSEYHGSVGSRNKVELIALVMGRIKDVHVSAGQQVSKGDVLVEMESDELEARLHAAKSRLAGAESDLIEAKIEQSRKQDLAKKKLVSRQDLDKAVAHWKSMEAAVESANAQVHEAQTMLSYALMKSPMNGIVIDKLVNPGDFTMPGLPAHLGYPAGRILMTIYDPNALWFEARIPERLSKYISVGKPARVSIGSADLNLEGQFVEVLPGIDETTRTFTARIELPSLPILKIGMFGRASFMTGQREVIEIPESAVSRRNQLDTVFILADGRAHLRLVRSGKRYGGNVEILSGLTIGEEIIVNPHANLNDGDRVAIEIAQP